MTGPRAVRGLLKEAEEIYNNSYRPSLLTGEGFDIKAINRDIAKMSDMRGQLEQAYRQFPGNKKYAKWRDKYDEKINLLKAMQRTHDH